VRVARVARVAIARALWTLGHKNRTKNNGKYGDLSINNKDLNIKTGGLNISIAQLQVLSPEKRKGLKKPSW